MEQMIDGLNTDRVMAYSSKHEMTVFEIQTIGTYTPPTPEPHQEGFLTSIKCHLISEKIYCAGPRSWFVQLQTNKFQGLFKDFSRKNYNSFQGLDSFNKSALFNSFLNTLLAKTRHGVIYDFYFFSHG